MSHPVLDNVQQRSVSVYMICQRARIPLPVRVIAIAAVCLAAMSPSPAAENLWGKPTRGLVGLKVGLISEGKLHTDSTEFSNGTGGSVQVFADLPINRLLRGSVAFDFHSIRMVNEWKPMIELSGGLKFPYQPKRSDLTFVPGFSLGLAHLPELNVLAVSDYVTLKAFLEVHVPINKKRSWVLEAALFGGPLGRNDDSDLTLGPRALIRAGVVLR